MILPWKIMTIYFNAAENCHARLKIVIETSKHEDIKVREDEEEFIFSHIWEQTEIRVSLNTTPKNTTPRKPQIRQHTTLKLKKIESKNTTLYDIL